MVSFWCGCRGQRLVCLVCGCKISQPAVVQDTEGLYTRVQQDICGRFGKEFTWELKAKMMGRKALPAAQTLIDALELQGRLTAEEFVAEREEKLHSLFPSCELMPGARALIDGLRRRRVPIAVATSSHRRHYELKTQRHGDFFALFDHVITGDAVEHGKPAPDIFQVAAARWSPQPHASACLVFEDAPIGVDAALAAGMRVVMVPDPNLDRAQTVAATEVLSSLDDFEPDKYGLPAEAV